MVKRKKNPKEIRSDIIAGIFWFFKDGGMCSLKKKSRMEL